MKKKIERNAKEPKAYTIPVERTRVQVTREVYQAYYGFERHLRTLEEKDTRNGTVRYSDLDTEETLGEEMIPYLDAPAVEATAVTHVMREALREAVTQLPEADYGLIQMLVYEGKTIRQAAQILCLPTMTIHYRKEQALKKLRKLLES